MLRTYGITPSDFEDMAKEQGGVCAICGRAPAGKKRRVLSVDHDYPTGAVRGLLCVRCNSCLGWVETFGAEVRTYLDLHAQAA